jgi:hypothetical protein
MTPRKELFIKIKQALNTISSLEYIDLNRNQFGSDKFPDCMVSALVKVNGIQWQRMVEQIQEGDSSVEVILYCRDGWRDQHNDTSDAEHGLIEIDLIDDIAEALEDLSGDYFTTLELTNDDAEQEDMQGVFAYKLTFSTKLFRKIKPKYSLKTITTP